MFIPLSIMRVEVHPLQHLLTKVSYCIFAFHLAGLLCVFECEGGFDEVCIGKCQVECRNHLWGSNLRVSHCSCGIVAELVWESAAVNEDLVSIWTAVKLEDFLIDRYQHACRFFVARVIRHTFNYFLFVKLWNANEEKQQIFLFHLYRALFRLLQFLKLSESISEEIEGIQWMLCCAKSADNHAICQV